MYSVSETFKDYIKRETVEYHWTGTVTDKDSDTYDLTDSNIAEHSSRITRRCSTDTLSIGTTSAAELELNLYLDVDRYKLFGGTVELTFTLVEGNDTEDVPMGIYNISECNQSSGKLSIIAYDNMTKFDGVRFNAIENNTIQSPFSWLTQACAECGVSLGMTLEEVEALPNGIRKTGFASVVTDIMTWRDLIGNLAAYLGGFAYIGRDGKLYIGQYSSNIVDEITSSFRSSSNLSDFRTTYDGLYAIYKNEGVQEYVENENTNGLILDLGTNPFLQFTDDGNRLDALQEIIDAWNDVYYVPYDSDMPIMPHYDLGDVIKFKNNQATEYDYGAITEIVYNIGGKTSVNCTGDNPILAEAQDRFSKSVEGISNTYNNSKKIGGTDFWMLFTTNTSVLEVGSTEVQIAEIEYKQSTYGQTLEMILIINAELSASAIVNIRVVVDDEEDLEMNITEEKEFAGKHMFHCSNPQNIYGVGVHACKVYMTVTDNAINVGDLY